MKQLFLLSLRLLGINRFFRSLHRGRIMVLLLHHVMERYLFENAVTPEEFRTLLRHLKCHYNVLGIDREGQWRGYDSSRVNVLLTFDDGFIDNVKGALPILIEEGVTALFFIIAECARTGSPPAFASKYGSPLVTPSLRTVAATELRALLDAGMTIGSHSLTHSDFRELSDEEALQDALRSRTLLSEISGERVGMFAFPWGHFSPNQPALIMKIYDKVFLTVHGFCSPQESLIPRNEVATPLHLEAVASGALDFFRRALRRPSSARRPQQVG